MWIRYVGRLYATYVSVIALMRQTSAYLVFNILEDRNISKVVDVVDHTTVPNALGVFAAQEMITIIITDVRVSGN